jgi:DNA-binding PadR family transcriptional regulator
MGRENKTIYAILGLLNHEDLSGYDIKKRIDLSLSYFWAAGFGQIYPSLSLMEKNGWVSKKVEDKESSREKILYSITESGREELLKWLSTPVEKEYVKFEILLKLFFGSQIEADKNIENIKDFKERYVGQIDVLKTFDTNLRKHLEESEDHLYYLLTVLFGEKLYKAYVEWSDEAIELLESSKKFKMEDDLHE